MLQSGNCVPRIDDFWEVLELAPGRVLSRVDWQKILGSQLGVVEDFLRPIDGRAWSYPCPRSEVDGCRRRVVEHAPDDIVAVCDSEVNECPRVAVPAADLVRLEVDVARLAVEISDLLGIVSRFRPTVGLRDVWTLGSFVLRADEELPVYLCLPSREETLRTAVLQLSLLEESRFLLLTGTTIFAVPDILDLLDRSRSKLLALEEILETDAGRFAASVDVGAWLGAPAETSKDRFIFRPKGEQWEAVFNGERKWLAHRAGFRYLAVLLENPGRAYTIQDLSDAAGDAMPASPAASVAVTELEVSVGETAARAVPDRAAIRAYRERLREIERMPELNLACADEKDWLEKELAATAGRGSSGRTPAETRRDRVYKNLHRSRKVIAKHHPALHAHLEAALHAGARSGQWRYCPESSISWMASQGHTQPR